MVFQTPTREVHTPLDPGADLMATQEGGGDLDLDKYSSSGYGHARISHRNQITYHIKP